MQPGLHIAYVLVNLIRVGVEVDGGGEGVSFHVRGRARREGEVLVSVRGEDVG